MSSRFTFELGWLVASAKIERTSLMWGSIVVSYCSVSYNERDIGYFEGIVYDSAKRRGQ